MCPEEILNPPALHFDASLTLPGIGRGRGRGSLDSCAAGFPSKIVMEYANDIIIVIDSLTCPRFTLIQNLFSQISTYLGCNG